MAGVAFGLALAFIAALIIFAFIDPFGWDLFGRQRFVPAANAIPPDVAFYFSLDLSQLDCDSLNPYIWAFSEELRAEGTCGLDELIEELDAELELELGMSFSEDVQPWLGGSLALGFSNFNMDFYGDIDDADVILAVEVRDPTAADEFLQAALENMALESGEPLFEEEYEGATLFYTEVDEASPPLVMSRSGDMLLFGIGKEDVKAAIDAQRGESLADLDGFNDAMSELPSDRAMTMFMNTERYMEMLAGLMDQFGGLAPTDILGASGGATPFFGAGISLVDVGVQMDMVSIMDMDELPANWGAAPQLGREPRTAAMMPEETYLYMVGAGLSQGIDMLEESMGEVEGLGDFRQAMFLFEMMFGFDPLELFSLLDGEYALGLIPSGEGALVDELDVPMGFVVVAETGDPQAVLSFAGEFGESMENQGMGEVEILQRADGTLYQLVDMFSGQMLITFGVANDHFVLGSSEAVITDLFAGGASLAESERYQSVWRAFPREMHPVMYLDFQGVIAMARESMPPMAREEFDQGAGQAWRAVEFLAAASAPPRGDVVRSALILFIDLP
jgi:hypothetical protein